MSDPRDETSPEPAAEPNSEPKPEPTSEPTSHPATDAPSKSAAAPSSESPPSEPSDPSPPVAALEHIGHAIERSIERLEARQKAEKLEEKAKSAAKERLTNRVSVAAICLTMLMSFLNFARAERDGAAGEARGEASRARSDADGNWTLYQSRQTERSNFAIADEELLRDVANLPDSDPRVRDAITRHAAYLARIAAIDTENRQLLYNVQDLEQRQLSRQRDAARIQHKINRYDVGIRVLTLAVVLLSVTLLANRGWLFWVAGVVAMLGAGIAVNGYFLLL